MKTSEKWLLGLLGLFAAAVFFFTLARHSPSGPIELTPADSIIIVPILADSIIIVPIPAGSTAADSLRGF